MKKSNSKSKAQSAFWKLGAVALITATMFFVACKQTGGGGGGGKPTPKPKHAINFSVDSTTPNGTLKAVLDGGDIASGNEVEEGKTVTFTAVPSANYKVKEWKVGDTVVKGNKTNTYTHTVTQATTVSVSFELSPVEGEAVLTLSPDKLTFWVKAKTADGSAITVKGCTVATLASEAETTLTATGTTVILKGNITELDFNKSIFKKNTLTALDVSGLTALQYLYCVKNQLTELNVQGLTALEELECGCNQLTSLNVQGCTALQKLECYSNKFTELNVQGLTALYKLRCQINQLNAQAMTKLLDALPTRVASDGAEAILYTEDKDYTEGNCKDYTQPESLKTAFENAKSVKHWCLMKINANGRFEDI